MPRLCAFLIICLPCIAHAADIKFKTEGWKLRYSLAAAFEPRYVPPLSPNHIQARDALPKKDPCVWVAGVRHCPLPRLPQ